MTTTLLVDLVAMVLAVLGVLLQLVAALGVLRMPDLLTRMHASSKAATLGTALILLAVGIHFGRSDILARTGLIILFLLLTAPVAAHMIGRAGYRDSRADSNENVIDEYRATLEAEDQDATERREDR
jgi:multicomponent Na+:H+ antiporter subunit G